MRYSFLHGISIVSLLLLGASVALGQWTTAQPVWNPADPNEANNNNAIKDPRVAGSATGGFHVTYRLFIQGGAIENRYRRYNGAALGPIKVVQSGIFTANSNIAEALNGDVHLVWENFDGSLDIAWSRSTDGGNTWSGPVEISNCGCDAAKWPGIAPFGTGNGPDMVMAFGDVSSNRKMRSQRWNGTSWSPGSAQNFADADSEYFITGICRSLQDGTVYRTYGRKVSSNPNTYGMFYRRYNGTSWEAEQTIVTSGFYAYPYIAVNQAGVVMVVWEQDSRIDSRWYTPGVGWSPVTVIDASGNHGQVTAIPGTNHFYAAFTTGQHIVEGRYWVNGTWLPKTTVSVGQPNNGNTFNPACRVTANADRSLVASWENWDSGNARGYYSIMTQSPALFVPAGFSRQIAVGGSLAPDTFILTNGGPGTISYTLSDNASWLEPSVTNGSSSGEDDAITINYSTAALHRGVYNGVITASGNASNSPASLSVTLTVTSVSPDFDGDGDVDQSDFGFLQSCLAGPATAPPAGCSSADLQQPFDGDVDAADMSILLGCFSGPDVLANMTCDQQ